MPGVIDLVGPKGYSHGWKYEGAPGRQGEIIDRLPTADKLSKAQLKAHLDSYHAGTPSAGGHRIGPRNPSKAQLLAMHEMHHGVNRPKNALFAMPSAHSHDASLPRPPAYMDTPNMRLAIRAGLLSANNRLGRPDRQTIQAANDHPTLMELAMPTTQPIRTPSDLLISRGDDGVAIIRHRMGGAEIGQIRRDGRGWRATVGGKDLDPRNHQRSALADVIGTHNKGALTPEHRPSAGSVLQPPAQQTPLMAQFGIPAIRALATPTTGTSDGPRVTSNGAGDSDDSSSGGSGLNAKGQQIYKKLKGRGFPEARAMAFAKRAQNMGGGK